MPTGYDHLKQLSVEDLCRLAFGYVNDEIASAVSNSRIFQIYAYYRAEEKLRAGKA